MDLDSQFARLRELAGYQPVGSGQVPPLPRGGTGQSSGERAEILEATIGRLNLGPFKDFLEKLKFIGYRVSWVEGSGLIEHDFVIKGDSSAIIMIKSWINWVGNQ